MAKEGMVAAAPAAPKKGLLMIVVAIVVAVAIGGGLAMYMTGGKKHHHKDDAEEADDSTPIPTVVFKDEFIVNLTSADGVSHFMRVPKLELDVASESVSAKVEANRSKIADRISSTLRSKSMQDMLQPGSDVKLKEELRNVINDTLDYKDERRGVREVILPGSFIVQ
ncbi:MAG TPA: flagellar basal body-associated FliL family protein [Methylophilaceae bacterium]|jgi:flagellar FliL protein